MLRAVGSVCIRPHVRVVSAAPIATRLHSPLLPFGVVSCVCERRQPDLELQWPEPELDDNSDEEVCCALVFAVPMWHSASLTSMLSDLWLH